MRITSKFNQPTTIKLEQVEIRLLERTAELCAQLARQEDDEVSKHALDAHEAIDHLYALLKQPEPKPKAKPAEQPEPVTTGKK